MGIDLDILQSKFRNEHQKAGVNLLYTYGWVMERTKELFASEDITPQQFNILRILRGSYPQPLSTLQIRERMLDKMSDTSRIVERMVSKGLVQKAISERDKRMVDHIKSFVKSENITPQQYNILRILRGAGEPLSTLQLRERMLDKMSDTSRIVERMVSKNLVKKAVSVKDKRMVDVVITPEGSELLENLDRRNEELDAVVNHLSDEELETLNNLLDKLRNNH